MRQSVIIAIILYLVACVIVFLVVNHLNINNNRLGRQLRDYQLEVKSNGQYLYKGDSLVGFIPFSNSKLDSLIIKDNQ